MTTQAKQLLAPLVRMRGVRAAVIVSERDGLVIESTSRLGLDVDAIAAFSASIIRRARVAGEEIVAGAPRVVTIDASAGRLFLAGAGDFVVAVVADREAMAGQLRITTQRVVADAMRQLDPGS
jgi:predicted regulator of Ras-like GTPase activity (Roadblock/LC7/MglB family)